MSKRNLRTSGCRIEGLSRAVDRPPEIGVPDRSRFEEVHPPAQEALQILEEAEESIRVLLVGHRLELHQEVEVTPLRVEVVPGRGAEQVQPRHTVLLAELP